jgi:DNA-binding CsgD family transcriptional regulator
MPSPTGLELSRWLGGVVLLDLLAQPSQPTPVEPTRPRELLTHSESRVLRYLPTHLRATEIAGELHLSVNTVKTHLRHLYQKLGANSRREAVERARALGLLAPSSVRLTGTLCEATRTIGRRSSVTPRQELGWTPDAKVRLHVRGASAGSAGENHGVTMQLTRQHVIDVLRRTGFAEAAEDASRRLPDPAELDDVLLFLVPYGITRDVLISEMGGSP